MSRVESAFLKRDAATPGSARLFLRFMGRGQPVEVAQGSEAELTALLRRLSVDLRPVKKRVNRIVPKQNLFESSRVD